MNTKIPTAFGSIGRRPDPMQSTELVLVEAVQQFRVAYAVEVPLGQPHLALQLVQQGRALEFCHHYLGETQFVTRQVQHRELQELYNQHYVVLEPTDYLDQINQL